MAKLLPQMGGRAGMTKQLKALYDQYNVAQQTDGLQAVPWPNWLQQNGYTLGEDLLVSPLGTQDIDKLIQRNSYQ